MNDYLLMIAGSDIDSFYQIEEFPEASEVTMAQPLGKKVGGCVLNVAAVSASKGINTKVLDYLKENDEDTELLINTLKRYLVLTTYRHLLFAGKILLHVFHNN